MRVTYYGPRGSLPAPGKETAKYGGNTTCLFIQAGDELAILDGGSGLRVLGHDLMRGVFGQGRGKAAFFWTHFHWDHIQGFPFFVPNYIPGNRFQHYGLKNTQQVLVRQQAAVNFPVPFKRLPSQHSFRVLSPGQSLPWGKGRVTSCPMRHPGGGITYRFDHSGKSLVFATDFEHALEGLDPKLTALSRDANLLIYDAQYTPLEYTRGHQGWGHSTWEKGVALANAAGVKRLHLFHHDPAHSDRFLEREILRPARRAFRATELAREGWNFEV